MAGFPQISIHPLCPCLHRSSGRSIWKDSTDSDLFSPFRSTGMTWLCEGLGECEGEGGVWSGIWGWLGRKGGGFYNHSCHFTQTLWRNTTWMWFLSWNYRRFNSIREGGPALHSFPYTLRDSCCLDEILLSEKKCFLDANFSFLFFVVSLFCRTVLFTSDWTEVLPKLSRRSSLCS